MQHESSVLLYLVVPTILEWEDRATEWSGIPRQSIHKDFSYKNWVRGNNRFSSD